MEILIVIVIFIVAPMGICPAILSNKGRSSCAGVLLGLFLSYIGVLICLLIPTDPEWEEREKLRMGIYRTCPDCLYGIPAETAKCGHCGSDLTAQSDKGMKGGTFDASAHDMLHERR